MKGQFHSEGNEVYATDARGHRVEIAEAASESWAETIAEALNNDDDAYVV